ncbi:hypothetical protein PYCCODRAFT_609159 [Trametes coccinea BRFM310]|uniref:Uncharacterized protein n=1 Tax=Trametes coccinea (strain BRFM310) TaxID=1353009 RepID=A0A1Y2J1Y0_TRAC3|nr:hypothetical protein PYCCODRAFT_609159 [Trametes coccinea BRFM310]
MGGRERCGQRGVFPRRALFECVRSWLRRRGDSSVIGAGASAGEDLYAKKGQHAWGSAGHTHMALLLEPPSEPRGAPISLIVAPAPSPQRVRHTHLPTASYGCSTSSFCAGAWPALLWERGENEGANGRGLGMANAHTDAHDRDKAPDDPKGCVGGVSRRRPGLVSCIPTLTGTTGGTDGCPGKAIEG